MNARPARHPVRAAILAIALATVVCGGCQLISNRLSKWKMLDQSALEDPIKAVGGDGIVFAPEGDERALSRDRLAKLTPKELIAYYSPVFIQQRVNTAAKKHPYPPEYDLIGTAQMQFDAKGQPKAVVSGQPAVYWIYQKPSIGGHEHVQLIYTAWYPAHPKMKAIDLEEADIDSCVVRVTLDDHNAPILFETIAACGCFHKAFVEKWLEDAAVKQFGAPERGKKYSVERIVKKDIDWEVAGIVDEPRDRPHRPVVFIKAGDHKVLGMGSTARLRVPQNADTRRYAMTDYQQLYELALPSGDRVPFFDTGGKVRGAERKERFLLSIVGVDSAGQPRANNQIKMHFDQSTWSDPTIYDRFLRLPPGTF